MKLAAAILVLSMLGGCASPRVDTIARFGPIKFETHTSGTYFAKDPHFENLRVTPWGVGVASYQSTTRVDAITAAGGIVGTIAGAAVKIWLGVP